MNALIDLHCHILPGVDDGPEDLAIAVELVQALEAQGFHEFYPTPHQKCGSFAPTSAETEAATHQLSAALKDAGSSAVIHSPAAENMWDELFFQRQPDRFPTYPEGKAFLIEFSPDSLPPNLGEHLFQFRVQGKLAVVAHVERYPELARNIGQIEKMGRSAALLVNLSGLGGINGWRGKRLARRLVKAGLIHAVSTDIHSLLDIPFCIAGKEWIQSKLGNDVLDNLLVENPRRIIAGELPELYPE